MYLDFIYMQCSIPHLYNCSQYINSKISEQNVLGNIVIQTKSVRVQVLIKANNPQGNYNTNLQYLFLSWCILLQREEPVNEIVKSKII